jgi:hypothetical protein
MSSSNIPAVTSDGHSRYSRFSRFCRLNEELDFLEHWDYATFGTNSNILYQEIYKERKTRELIDLKCIQITKID